jgi:hypothetical protein
VDARLILKPEVEYSYDCSNYFKHNVLLSVI